MVKAADMLIARRADTRARADFATWKMMAKLNGASALPAEAQNFLGGYKKLLGEMTRDNTPLADALSTTDHEFGRERIAELLKPRNYTGCAAELADRALARYRASTR